MTLWDEFYENMMIVYSYLLHIVVSDESCVDVIILLKTQGVSARSAPAPTRHYIVCVGQHAHVRPCTPMYAWRTWA